MSSFSVPEVSDTGRRECSPLRTDNVQTMTLSYWLVGRSRAGKQRYQSRHRRQGFPDRYPLSRIRQSMGRE